MFRLTIQCLTAILLLCACGVISQAQGVITVRLSYKVILNSADGNRPTYTNAAGMVVQVTDADLDAAINTMNKLFAAYSRGYRFQRVDPVTNIGGKGDATGPSKYFNNDFRTAGTALRNQLEDTAMRNTAYAWNKTAINIYINQGTSGGYCSFPNEGRNIIMVGAISANAGNTQLHEVGHYFNLCHTHGCDDNTTDDGIADTLVDNPAWDEDRIAGNSFPDKTYTQLSAGEKLQVDDVILNLMSYHGTTGNQGTTYNHPGETTNSRLTEQQLDRWTDAACLARRFVCDGYTIFVEANGAFGTGQLGSSTNPLSTISEAKGWAALGLERGWKVVLLLRPGNYNELVTFDGGVTLRATRRGGAIIGQ